MVVLDLDLHVQHSHIICSDMAWHTAQAVAFTGQLSFCPSGQQANAAVRHMPGRGMRCSALNPNP